MPIISPYKNLSPVAQKTSAGTPISAAFGTPSVTAQALDVLAIEWGFTPSQDVTVWTMTLRDGATVLGTDFGGPVTEGNPVTPSIAGVNAIDGTDPREITAELDLDGTIIVAPTTFTPFSSTQWTSSAAGSYTIPEATATNPDEIWTLDSFSWSNVEVPLLLPGGVSNIHLAWLGQLVRLGLANTNSTITDVGLQSLTSLTFLDLVNTSSTITDTSLQNLTSLTFLRLASTNSTITDVGLQNLTSLTYISLLNTSSTITDTSLQNLTSLTVLSLFNTNSTITDVGLQSLTSLTFLDLSNTNSTITDVGLQSLTSLTILSLANTNSTITDVGLQNLTGLTFLSLQSTEINNLQLDGVVIGLRDRFASATISALATLNISGNRPSDSTPLQASGVYDDPALTGSSGLGAIWELQNTYGVTVTFNL
jgi:Leucine-rich repeat (LRR) protein